jgi:hypothetical protein
MTIVAFALLICLMAYMAVPGLLWAMTLRPDERKPYTFWCKKCGMRFDTFGTEGTSADNHLEPVGKVTDFKCRCLDPWRRDDWLKKAEAQDKADMMSRELEKRGAT